MSVYRFDSWKHCPFLRLILVASHQIEKVYYLPHSVSIKGIVNQTAC